MEERIEEFKARKAELADAVLEGGGSRERLSFDEGDLDALLAPSDGNPEFATVMRVMRALGMHLRAA